MTNIPAGARVPQDHKKSAVQLEAEKVKTLTVEFNGHEFTILADPLDWNAGILRAFEMGRSIAAIRLLIGPAVYDQRKMDSWSGRELNDFADVLAEAGGFERMGN